MSDTISCFMGGISIKICECVFICLVEGWAWCEIAGMKSSTSASDSTDLQPEKIEREQQLDLSGINQVIRHSTMTRVDLKVNLPYYLSTTAKT